MEAMARSLIRNTAMNTSSHSALRRWRLKKSVKGQTMAPITQAPRRRSWRGLPRLARRKARTFGSWISWVVSDRRAGSGRSSTVTTPMPTRAAMVR